MGVVGDTTLEHREECYATVMATGRGTDRGVYGRDETAPGTTVGYDKAGMPLS
jgi:hypothetical protein